MIFKKFDVTVSSAMAYNDTILEIGIAEPETGNPNKIMYYQPATVELKVTGSNPVYIEFVTSVEDTESNLQGGMLLDVGEKYVLDFNMGLYKIKTKASTGTSTLRVNGMYYIRVNRA